MKMMKIAAVAAAFFAATAVAEAQQGPVAAACASEIEQYCKGLPHAFRAVRNCLEKNKASVGESCRQALDTTGPGRGCGQGRGCGRWRSNN